MIEKIVHYLSEPVDNASVVFFRMAFGAMMVVEILYEYLTGNLKHVWADPQLHFYYAGFSWLPEVSGDAMFVLFGIAGGCALLVSIGLFYRVAAAFFAIGYSYIFLIEQAAYQNHLYLFCLLGILMVVLPLNRSASMDVRLGRLTRESQISRWVVWLLRFQIGVVYFFGGISKLNADWFGGEPMRMWLARRTDYAVIGPFVHDEWLVSIFTFGGLFFDLLIVGFLLWKKTRWPAFMAVVLFNITNAFLFKIGPFPWVMLLATPIFFEPDWPRRLSLYLRRTPAKPIKGQPFGVQPMEPPKHQNSVLTFVGLYVVWQLLMPLRPFLYPNNASWSDEAHFFSWRMMLRDKTLSEARVIIHDPESLENKEVDPATYMEPWQRNIMFGNPELIRQFSNFIAERARDSGRIMEPAVYARVLVSLNGRTPELLIDPTADLSAQAWSFRSADWIMPAPE